MPKVTQLDMAHAQCLSPALQHVGLRDSLSRRAFVPQESQTATHFSFTDGEVVLEASIIHLQFCRIILGQRIAEGRARTDSWEARRLAGWPQREIRVPDDERLLPVRESRETERVPGR